MHSTTGHHISTAMRHDDMLLFEKIVATDTSAISRVWSFTVMMIMTRSHDDHDTQS